MAHACRRPQRETINIYRSLYTDEWQVMKTCIDGRYNEDVGGWEEGGIWGLEGWEELTYGDSPRSSRGTGNNCWQLIAIKHGHIHLSIPYHIWWQKIKRNGDCTMAVGLSQSCSHPTYDMIHFNHHNPILINYCKWELIIKLNIHTHRYTHRCTHTHTPMYTTVRCIVKTSLALVNKIKD